ncbi:MULTISPECIES: TIGR02452 family protein [Streptacidiphilus]|uniref:TIGR02452 family protein n=1 Tax=Streptacidiphilus cavernicola TaxID=3342716 RepID=A0ABV6UUF2_9ACTN|nr:TIGR02452 family protein [Streptacidiphilus jeojiense]
MSSRLRQYATVNEEIAAAGQYRAADGRTVPVGPALAAAAEGTRCYSPEEPLDVLEHADGGGPRIEVTAEGSLAAAQRLFRAGPGEIAVLNFASARNPGGGYLRGAKAQEEDLCRHALLYHCLLQAPEYYAAHRASDDLLYSDRVIWSPGVPVIRDEDGGLLAEPFPVSFLTSPAPNAGQVLRRSPGAGAEIRAVLRRRAARVLAVAAHHRVRRLVLGAWGCGVFANDPAEVASAFRDLLVPGAELRSAFDEVVFAVRDRASPSANREAFREAFADAQVTPLR